MKVKFLQDYEGYKKGDIVDSAVPPTNGGIETDDWLTIQELIRKGVVSIIKQKKHYSDKMMRDYHNK